MLQALKAFSLHLGRVLGRYGGSGLVAINFLDSSFLAFPVINDLLLLHLAAQRPNLAMVYALDSMAGSVLGAFAVYGLSRHGWSFLRRKPGPSRHNRAKRWLHQNDFVTVLVASLLPPPAPFKVVPIVAGALEVNPTRFGVALVVGRGARFFFEAFIGMHYGRYAEGYLRRHLTVFSLSMAGVIVAAAIVYHLLREEVTSEAPEV